VAAALAETATANLVTREYLDLRIGALEARLRGEIATILCIERAQPGGQ
jgi:hypothetical protein